MLIILEGNECCFKTTIAEKLHKELNIPIIKGSSFEHSQCTNEELIHKFKELTKLNNTIIDRFIYSNRVYATLYKDYAILTNEQRKEIEDLIKNKATVYYLHADDNVIEERIRQRGDEYVDVSMVGKINDEYTRAILDCNLRIQVYNTNEWTSNEITEEIIKDNKLN
ncbi:AAA family ATPase [Bacillus sp. Bva_UNVM-123]|uniref:hypothetical protein n=1 Tax=Bacillus sp. Bva_UNVM-123 TaxID=2829798 RepID=UPI00391F40C9